MIQWKVGIVTVSDRSFHKQRSDESGKLLHQLCDQWNIAAYEIIPDEQEIIENTLRKFADERRCHLVLTTGGTGFSPRDVTPEATRAVIEKEAPGLGEAMRATTFKHTPMAILSRAIAGIRGRTLIINFPGSPRGVSECFHAISNVIPHALQILSAHQDPH